MILKISPAIFLSKKFKFFSKICTIGEIFVFKDVCKKCPVSTYSLVNPMENIEAKCEDCRENAFCPGGNKLIPKTGYWRFSGNSSVIYQCFIAKACLGGPLTNEMILNFSSDDIIHGKCLEGHYGPLCNDCIEGYGKPFNFSICSKCNLKDVVRIIEILFFSIIVLTYLLCKSQKQVSNASNNLECIFKIVINHFQFLIIISNDVFEVELKEFFSFFIAASSVTGDSFSDDCFMQILLNVPFEEFYLSKSFLLMSLPFLFSLLCFFFVVLFRKWKYNCKKFFYLFIKITLAAIFLFYPLMVKYSLSLFNCFHFSEIENEEFLYNSPTIRCWVQPHKYYAFSLGFFGIFILGIGLPFLLFFYLKYRQNMKKSKSSFLIGEYRNQFFYWEAIIFFKKFIIILISNIPNLIGEEIQNLCYFSFLFFYFYLLLMKNPYFKKEINFLQEISIFSLIFCRLNFIIGKRSSNKSLLYTLIALIFMANIAFSLYSIKFFCRFIEWRKLKGKFTLVYSHIKRKLILNSKNKKKRKIHFPEKKQVLN